MAGRPLTRQRAQLAEAAVENQAQAHLERIQRIHTALAKRGIDPAEIDTSAPPATPPMTEYTPDLPMAVLRLAGAGQAIEEIRDTLGFSEAQQQAWAHSYVDMASAISRARAREEAFWLRQMRVAAESGDRTSVTSIQSLISKRFMDTVTLGNAADLVVVHIGARLDQRVSEDD